LLIVVFPPAIAVSACVFVTTAAAAAVPPPPPSPPPLAPPHEHLRFLWCAKKFCQPYFHSVCKTVQIGIWLLENGGNLWRTKNLLNFFSSPKSIMPIIEIVFPRSL
jgi:hypothetical protein